MLTWLRRGDEAARDASRSRRGGDAESVEVSLLAVAFYLRTIALVLFAFLVLGCAWFALELVSLWRVSPWR